MHLSGGCRVSDLSRLTFLREGGTAIPRGTEKQSPGLVVDVGVRLSVNRNGSNADRGLALDHDTDLVL